MTALLVHNPTAGTGKVSADQLLSLLDSNGIEADIVSRKEDGWREAVREAEGLIVVAGGDGTVAKVADALGDSPATMAILPTGGANNIAHSYGVPQDLAAAAALMPGARPKPFDLAKAEGAWGRRRFFESVGFGLLTEALCALDKEPDKRAEKLALGRKAIRARLEDAAPVGYRLSIDGTRTAEILLMLEVLAIPQVGPRLPLAGKANPGEGRLHVVSVTDEARERFGDWLDSPDGVPPVTVRQAHDVEVIDAPDQLRIDDCKGTICRDAEPVRLSIHRSDLSVLVPGDARGDDYE